MHDADDAPLAAAAPSAWQASRRMVALLETHVRQRGEEVKAFDINPYPYEGTWRPPK